MSCCCREAKVAKETASFDVAARDAQISILKQERDALLQRNAAWEQDSAARGAALAALRFDCTALREDVRVANDGRDRAREQLEERRKRVFELKRERDAAIQRCDDALKLVAAAHATEYMTSAAADVHIGVLLAGFDPSLQPLVGYTKRELLRMGIMYGHNLRRQAREATGCPDFGASG